MARSIFQFVSFVNTFCKIFTIDLCRADQCLHNFYSAAPSAGLTIVDTEAIRKTASAQRFYIPLGVLPDWSGAARIRLFPT